MKGDKVIIARYGEVHLKGANRGFFLRLLTNNLVAAVGMHCKVKLENSRYIFTDFKEDMAEFLVTRISKVFGLTSVSVCDVVGHGDILEYLKAAAHVAPRETTPSLRATPSEGRGEQRFTFKVIVNRADKTFPHTSMEFAAMVGSVILNSNPNARVDVHNPDKTIYIDIREGGIAYIYEDAVPAVGGMPVGSAGSALVMLSGGIDSPVAAYLAAKRGLSVDCIHFASPPYTSDMALDKIKRLRDVLIPYCGNIKIYVVPFTEIQEQIRDKCSPEYMITIMRRFMVLISTRHCEEHRDVAIPMLRADCLITGENLAQVASQTIHGITTNNVCAEKLPILRPLITYDKSEIVTLAKQIGTYDISIEPHLDCCTVFVPPKPVIKPTIEKCEREERKLDLEGLITRAIEGKNVI